MRTLLFIFFLLPITLWGCRNDSQKDFYTKKLTNYTVARDLVDHEDILSGDIAAVTTSSSDESQSQDLDAIYVIENNTVTTTDLDDVIGDFKQEDTGNGVLVSYSPVTQRTAPPPTTTPTTTTTSPITNPTLQTAGSRQAHQFTVRGTLPRNPNTDVDIIWYLDNSGSMGDSIRQVKNKYIKLRSQCSAATAQS